MSDYQEKSDKSSPPSVPSLGVTGFTKRTQVGIGMSTAVFRRDNVVDFIGGNITTVLEALLAERVSRNINATNPSPLPTVKLVMVGVTKSVILTTCDELMLGTITLGGESGTMWIFTGFEELIWHRKPPNFG